MSLICTVATLRELRADSLRLIEYHRAQGITHQFLFFDDPLDSAIEDVEQAVDVTVFRRHPNAPELLTDRQTINATVALAKARERGFTWIAHIDADERIYSTTGRSISAELEALEEHPSVFLWAHEAVPSELAHADPFSEITRFRNTELRSAVAERTHLKCLFNGEYNRGHMGKSISQVARVDSLSIHFAHDENGQKYVPFKQQAIALKHYESVTFEMWKRKWGLKKDGIAVYDSRKNRNEQFEKFLACDGDEDALKALYRSLYLIDEAEVAELKQMHALIELA